MAELTFYSVKCPYLWIRHFWNDNGKSPFFFFFGGGCFNCTVVCLVSLCHLVWKMQSHRKTSVIKTFTDENAVRISTQTHSVRQHTKVWNSITHTKQRTTRRKSETRKGINDMRNRKQESQCYWLTTEIKFLTQKNWILPKLNLSYLLSLLNYRDNCT